MLENKFALIFCYLRDLYWSPQLLPSWRSRHTHAILEHQEVDGTSGWNAMDLICTNVEKIRAIFFFSVRAVLWVWPLGTGTSCVPGSSGHAFGTSANSYSRWQTVFFSNRWRGSIPLTALHSYSKHCNLNGKNILWRHRHNMQTLPTQCYSAAPRA